MSHVLPLSTFMLCTSALEQASIGPIESCHQMRVPEHNLPTSLGLDKLGQDKICEQEGTG
jgi:hypothetical protein